MPIKIFPIFVLPILLFITACDDKQKIQTEEPLRPVRTIIASASDGITGRDFPGIVIAEKDEERDIRLPVARQNRNGKSSSPQNGQFSPRLVKIIGSTIFP